MRKIKRALISVWDKTGLIDFSRGLNKLGIEIIATGGTKKKLKDAGIPVIPVSDIIDFPEILGGRVKSMHPVIQAGLLALRDNKQHMEQLKKHNIKPIDMVVSNLYPFSEVIKKDKVKLKEVLDFIDIGGPTMIRAAAKNYKHVVVITNPGQYDKVLEKLKKGDLNEKTRIKLAVEAFRLTAEYDARIDEFLQKHVGVETLPDVFSIKFKKTQDLRYGENPHQKGALYTGFTTKGPSVANAKQLHGKKMSYLNYLDANAAFELVKEFKEPTVAVIKHTSPCGLGCGKTVLEAFEKAYSSDPISAFGGVVSCNRKIDVVTAKRISEIFFHVLIAPGYEKGALEFLKKRKNLRILETGDLLSKPNYYTIARIEGGLLVQDHDNYVVTEKDLKVVTEKKPTKEEIETMLFAWKAVKYVKSNGIVLSKDKKTYGAGLGQTSRVGAVKIAIEQAGDDAKGCVMASDAFFPFRDAIDEAAKAGIIAIIQPGGSIRDKEVIDAANEHGIAMVFTGIRVFRH
jgi:phosphoribosylaminoimidazolecarboxamide formyltransferase/IMP cyclohydrolase